jgi:hypothetical protein
MAIERGDCSVHIQRVALTQQKQYSVLSLYSALQLQYKMDFHFIPVRSVLLTCDDYTRESNRGQIMVTSIALVDDSYRMHVSDLL